MSPAVSTLRVWLVSEAPAGEWFLTDLCDMLVAAAAKSQCVLSFQRSESPPGRQAVVDAPVELPAVARESGVHRAQVVLESSIGRVETVLAAVELLAPNQPPTRGRPAGSILKTYNYALGSVIVHATGEKYALADVLAGNAG